MIITCPSCKRKYRIDGGLLKPPYQKLRCSLCGHVFTYEQPAPEDDDGLPDIAALAKAARPAPAKRRKRAPLSIAIAALLVVLAGLAYLYWVNYLGASDKWLSMRNIEGQETVIANGKIFLVKGVILNGSTKTRKYAILKAKLFDDGGKVIAEHFALAGFALSFDEARTMSSAEIEKKAADFRLSSLSAFALFKNKVLPFSIVFPGTYASKPKEFTVEIVEAPLL